MIAIVCVRDFLKSGGSTAVFILEILDFKQHSYLIGKSISTSLSSLVNGEALRPQLSVRLRAEAWTEG